MVEKCDHYLARKRKIMRWRWGARAQIYPLRGILKDLKTLY
jgi:hypothetical protein